MNLREQVIGSVPEHLLPLVPNRFQVIGDVAVLSIPPELDDYKTVLAEHIVMQRKNIKTVLNKTAMLQGDDRVARFETLGGNSTQTLHREYGYAYKLDVEQVFFNPRLSFERHRIEALVKPSEHVLVPFCGVGPFAIPAAAKGARVIALEKNAAACRWLAENIKLNRVAEHISPILCDALPSRSILTIISTVP